eukprot:Skav226618  [mRNA]  locus=scaffold2041:315569:315778:- [translate_table: standard]
MLEHLKRRAVDDWNESRAKVLFATDKALEGFVIKEADIVLCFDAPRAMKEYRKRIGHTGRTEAGDAHFP